MAIGTGELVIVAIIGVLLLVPACVVVWLLTRANK
jgi:hypothetical protein